MRAVYQQNQCCTDLLILTQKINAENDFEKFGQTIGLQIKGLRVHLIIVAYAA